MVWRSTARTFLSRTHVTAVVHLTRSQLSMGAERPPTTVVPDLIGMPLMTARERAHSVQLTTKVLGTTWYTNLSPGQITLQSPEAGQRVPFETTIGVELAVVPPDWTAPPSVKREGDRCGSSRRRLKRRIMRLTVDRNPPSPLLLKSGIIP
jgi:hypothetical protein